MHYNYRPAHASDLESIVRIYNESIRAGGLTADLDELTTQERKDWFRDHTQEPYGVYVVEDDGAEVIGYFCFSPWRKGRRALASVTELCYYLTHSHLGQGLGNHLMEWAEVLARKKGFAFLLAILLDTNVPSACLLQKYGFRIYGELPDVARLPNRTCAQLLMMKKI